MLLVRNVYQPDSNRWRRWLFIEFIGIFACKFCCIFTGEIQPIKISAIGYWKNVSVGVKIEPGNSFRFFTFLQGDLIMPLYEVETDAHIIITWADNEGNATSVATDSYPGESIVRLTKRPRDSWVISKGVLGLTEKSDPCVVARDCLSKAAGDKIHAIRLYMHETGNDLEQSRRAIESNMVMGW